MIQTRELALRVFIATTVVIFTGSLLFTLWYGRTLFFLVFAAVLLALFLRKISDFLHDQTGLPERGALTIVLIGLCAALAGLGFWIGPNLADQAEELMNFLPQSMASLKTWLGDHSWGKQLLREVVPSGTNAGKPQIDEWLATIGGMFSQSLSVITYLVVVTALGIFIAAEPEVYRRTLVRIFPQKARGRAEEVLTEMAVVLRRWLFARLISMTLVGILTAFGLWMLGVPLALTLAIVAMVLGFIPNLGPILAAIPAVLIALLQSTEKALYVVFLYTAIQTVESYIITPMLQRKAIEMPPALLISLQVLFGFFFGFLGLLLATPICASGLVLIRRVYLESVLHDLSPEPFPPKG